MRKFVPLIVLVALVATAVPLAAYQADTPQPTQPLLTAALKEGASTHKNVLVLFGASWCGWCKRLHAAMEQPDIAKTFADNYVILHLDTDEQPKDKAALENPGAHDLMVSLGGEKSGLPFYAFLNPKGKKLADSNVMPVAQKATNADAAPAFTNIGYPGSPEEIAAFEKLIKKTAPKMATSARTQLIDYLKKNAPPPPPSRTAHGS